MPIYMLQATYTQEGTKGLLKDGGSKRQAAVRTLVESLGGQVVGCYFAFGENDVVIIAELPDNSAAASASLTVTATGMVNARITVLLSPEDVDAAVKKSPSYTPPGR